MSQTPTGTSDSTPAPQAAVILRASDGSGHAYERHEPEKTILYKILSEHLETFLGEVRDHYDKPLPKYVEKATRHGNETQRVMTPLQFMSRLVALIPPPYHPLLRYFGVFGPHSSWRKDVVPEVAPANEHQHDHGKRSDASSSKPDPSDSASRTSLKSLTDPTVAPTILTATARSPKQEACKDDIGPRLDASWRIDWATLLRRVYKS